MAASSVDIWTSNRR